MAAPKGEQTLLEVLLTLTLALDRADEVHSRLTGLTEQGFKQLASLANANHVVLRALAPLQDAAEQHGNLTIARLCEAHIALEQQRIRNAVEHLFQITEALQNVSCPVTVMKSLDHWPDFGSDLDLYTTASATQVRAVLTRRFGAHIELRSWGDRLADKWNFAVPGLPEPVEVHCQRLGQTGEQTTLAERFVTRRVSKTVLGLEFHVPAPEERILIATLQRMYRHFYIRLCDVANLAGLVESGCVDFDELHRAASGGGIWTGVCSLLRIVSEYVFAYRGTPVALPSEVLTSASFGANKTRLRRGFIRVRIVPQAARLYTGQVANTARHGDLAATLRLSLLPYLASAAAISYKLTGSDKGIW